MQFINLFDKSRDDVIKYRSKINNQMQNVYSRWLIDPSRLARDLCCPRDHSDTDLLAFGHHAGRAMKQNTYYSKWNV